MACAPFDKDATLETQKEPTPQSVEKNTPQDSIRIKIPKDFFDSLYHEWSLQWKKNYSRDTALYQGITNCMHPENNRAWLVFLKRDGIYGTNVPIMSEIDPKYTFKLEEDDLTKFI